MHSGPWIAGAETPDPGSSPGQALIRGRNDKHFVIARCWFVIARCWFVIADLIRNPVYAWHSMRLPYILQPRAGSASPLMAMLTSLFSLPVTWRR